MVAYSFQKQFADPILMGRKRHTIRAQRKRHARPDEQLQLYTGMRTKSCRLIARATCSAIGPISLHFGPPEQDMVKLLGVELTAPALDEFAQDDGFANWTALRKFWSEQYGPLNDFEGLIIYWKDMAPA